MSTFLYLTPSGASSVTEALVPYYTGEAQTALVKMADKTKLDSVASGATANSPDAVLLNRANHSGTQTAATITGLATIATSGSAADLTGDLAVSRLNGGLGAGASTFWRGDGTWATPTGGGTVTSINITGTTGITPSGGPITGSGSITLTLSTNLQNWSAIATTRLGQVPITDQNATYTFVAGDAGNARRKTNTTAYTYTVDNSIHSAGDVITVVNNGSSGNITIAAGAGVTLRLGGTTTTGNRTLAPYGVAYIYFQSASEAIVSGAGVT